MCRHSRLSIASRGRAIEKGSCPSLAWSPGSPWRRSPCARRRTRFAIVVTNPTADRASERIAPPSGVISAWQASVLTAWRLGARQHGHLRAGSTPGSGPSSVRRRGNADDRLLAPLRRHRGWTLLGLIVAVIAAATRFASIGILPPIDRDEAIRARPSEHPGGAREDRVVRIQRARFCRPALHTHLRPGRHGVQPRDHRIRGARGWASRVEDRILGPLWIELWRSQQWASGPQRDRQIVIEKDPYQITINQETTLPAEGPGPGPGPPVIDVLTQAPSTEAAARLASAVPAALSAYIQHMQATAGVPERDRYRQSARSRVGCSRADLAACRRSAS